MKKAFAIIFIGLLISIMLILFSNASFYDYSKPGLEITKSFFQSIEDGHYELAKEHVDYILKERINHFKYADKMFNQEIYYQNEKYRVLEQGSDYIIIRANYTLIKRNDNSNIKKPVIMDVYLKPVDVYQENKIVKRLKIIYFKEV